MQRHDPRGNPVATDAGAAIEASERALWRLMSFYGPPLDDIAAAVEAAPGWALPRLQHAGFLLSLTEPGLAGEARQLLQAAEPLLADDRERGHHAALGRLAGGDWEGARVRWQALLDRYPRDALALQWSHLADFYRGDATGLLQRPESALPHWPADDPLRPYVLGLLAFGLEESGRYAEAEATGRQALAGGARVPWAIHAVGHVMEMQGRHDDGRRWMSATEPQWAVGNGFAGHLGWHHALFALEQMAGDDALALFDAHLDPAMLEITLQRLDAASLLWRCRLLGFAVGDRWQRLLAGWPLPIGEAGGSAFNDLHAVFALVGAGESRRAAAYVDAAEANAGRSPGSNRAVMRDAGAALLRGVLAFAEERFDAATQLLAPAWAAANARCIGGSHAQRDVIAQTLLAAAAAGGDRRTGRALLTVRRLAKPDTPLTAHWTRRLAD